MNGLLDASGELFRALGAFCKGWPKAGWSWDTRLSCVASSFSVDLVEEAEGATRLVFVNVWTPQSLRNAPPAICDVARSTGGLRDEQRILSSAPGGGIVAYGLWWPWGDETTISLRVGLVGNVIEPDTWRLRELFGAAE